MPLKYSPKLNLALADGSDGADVNFIDWRTAIDGSQTTSNFMIIDTELGGALDDIEDLKVSGGISYLTANNTDNSNYSADIAGVTEYISNATFALSVDSANTSAPFLSINDLPLIEIRWQDNDGSLIPLTSNSLRPNNVYLMKYDSTGYFVLYNAMIPKGSLLADQVSFGNALSFRVTHSKSGNIHNISQNYVGYDILKMFSFTATGDFAVGDTFTINNVNVTTEMSGGLSLPNNYFVAGDEVIGVYNDAAKSIIFNYNSGGQDFLPITGDGKDVTISEITEQTTGEIEPNLPLKDLFGRVDYGIKNAGKKYASVVIGTTTSGHTASEVDFLCDGVNDSEIIENAFTQIGQAGIEGDILFLSGEYRFNTGFQYPQLDESDTEIGYDLRHTRIIGEKNTAFIITGGSIGTDGLGGGEFENLSIYSSQSSYKGVIFFISSGSKITNCSITNVEMITLGGEKSYIENSTIINPPGMSYDYPVSNCMIINSTFELVALGNSTFRENTIVNSIVSASHVADNLILISRVTCNTIDETQTIYGSIINGIPQDQSFDGTQAEWDALPLATQLTYKTVYIHE